MSTYVQIGLIWLIYGVAMLTLEVRTGLLEGLYKGLLQLGQPLPPTRNALHSTKTMCVCACVRACVRACMRACVPLQDLLTGTASLVIRCQKPLKAHIQQIEPGFQAN